MTQANLSTLKDLLKEETNENEEPFDPLAIKREKIIHKSKYSWKPGFAFVPDNVKTINEGHIIALISNWERLQEKWVEGHSIQSMQEIRNYLKARKDIDEGFEKSGESFGYLLFQG